MPYLDNKWLVMPEMKTQVRVCDCNHSFPVDAAGLKAVVSAGEVSLHHGLCRHELPVVMKDLAAGCTVAVSCTQEAVLFTALAETAGSRGTLSCFNLRELAGRSSENVQALPKMAALTAAAITPLAVEPVPALQIVAGDRLLIVGAGDVVLGWAERLAKSFDVAVLITDRGGKVDLPLENAYPVWSGQAVELEGHLGSFTVRWEQKNPIDLEKCIRCHACIRACPEGAIDFGLQVDLDKCRNHRACEAACASVGAIDFARQNQQRTGQFDLIFDLSATPLLRCVELPDGYVAPGRDPFDQALAVQTLAACIGTFEKPYYVHYTPRLCAHSRVKKTGCTQCLDVCATEAITSSGDGIRIDPFLCKGCGTCTAVCPSGAVSFQYPRVTDLGERIRQLLSAYQAAGGDKACLLMYSAEAGDALIQQLARRGKGLPARVIPVEVWSTDMAGLDVLLGAIALGAVQVVVLTAGIHDSTPLHTQTALAGTILAGLGYGAGRMLVIDAEQPDEWPVLEQLLWGLELPAPVVRPARFHFQANKRETLEKVLRHLHDEAPVPVDEIVLKAGAPFGGVSSSDACTVCMACTSVCPAGALRSAPDAYRLEFIERNCLQCGLCVAACPEAALTLHPRLHFGRLVDQAVVLQEAQMFHCAECGKAMGAVPVIEAMIARLGGHTMFASEAAQARLRLCGDCRVIDLMRHESGLKAWDMKQ